MEKEELQQLGFITVVFLALVFSTQGARGEVFMEQSTDRWGGDYRVFAISANPEACHQACIADDGCRAWTYVRPGGSRPQALCRLKSAVPKARANPCCISGLLVGTGAVNRPYGGRTAQGLLPRRSAVPVFVPGETPFGQTDAEPEAEPAAMKMPDKRSDLPAPAETPLAVPAALEHTAPPAPLPEAVLPPAPASERIGPQRASRPAPVPGGGNRAPMPPLDLVPSLLQD